MNETSAYKWREDIRDLLERKGSKLAADPVAVRPSAPKSDGQALDDLPLDDIKSAVKAFLSREWQLNGEDALEYLSVVFPDGRHDEILFCIFLLTVFKRRLPAETWPEVEMWLEHIDHWVVCDQLAINVAGRLVLADKTRWRALQLWTQSPNEWKRRFAVTTAGIVRNKGGRKSKDVLKLIDSLMNDPSTHVQNVVAWAIRQVAGADEHLAVNFLKKWKGRCQHEIFREATLRLSPDAKITVMKAKSHHA